MLNTVTNKVDMLLGKDETTRFLNVSLYQGAPAKRKVNSIVSVSSSQTPQTSLIIFDKIFPFRSSIDLFQLSSLQVKTPVSHSSSSLSFLLSRLSLLLRTLCCQKRMLLIRLYFVLRTRGPDSISSQEWNRRSE